MAGPTDVVIAGTKPFALALFAPVTERAGTRPRIAPEPSAALTLCADSSGVLVVEYEPRWLPALTQLRQQRPGLRVVAALAPGQEGAAPSLGPLLDRRGAVGRAGGLGAAGHRAGHRRLQRRPRRGRPRLRSGTEAPARLRRPSATEPGHPATSGLPARNRLEPTAEPILDLFTDLGGHRRDAGSRDSLGTVRRHGRAGAGAGRPRLARHRPERRRGRDACCAAPLAGAGELSPLRAVAEQAVAGLSALEREVFTGGALAVDAEPIRHAAVLRLRVAAALATRPPPGSRHRRRGRGRAAVGDRRAARCREGAARRRGPAEAQVSLEAIRNALVKEAVDFSEACHEAGTGTEAVAAVRAAAARARRGEPGAHRHGRGRRARGGRASAQQGGLGGVRPGGAGGRRPSTGTDGGS